MKNLITIFLQLILFSSFALSQTDPQFDSYLTAERANLPVDGELLYNCANVGAYRFGGAGGALKKVVTGDSSLPFGKAVQLTVQQVGANAWEPQFQSPANSIPVERGDVLFYIFYSRVLESSDASGTGKGYFYVQCNSSPWTGLGSSGLIFLPSWRKTYVVAQAGEDFPAGSMEFTIHLGYFNQTVEIGGIIALNLGQDVDLNDLPRNPLYWDGMEADAAWRAEAAARIEQFRQGDLTVIVKNENDVPIKEASVKIEMKNHAFGFGTFMSELALRNTPDAQKYKDEVLKLFNRATTPFYMGDGNWGWYGPGSSQTNYPALARWLMDHDIPAKGHVLIWPSWKWMPPFFRDYENDPAGMRAALDEHLETLVPIGEENGLVQWDVVNEPHINHDVMDICGEDIMVHWYNKVHELDPSPRLILNEYNIIMGGGHPAYQADFEFYIELLLNNNAPLGGIGMQCHFDENLPGIPRLLDILNRFSKYDLPIQITEFDIDTIDEEAQAAFTRDFFTAVFSHPVTDKIIMWGFWEGDQWKPNGAMIRTDWSCKPNYHVYNDLVFDEWWTDEAGMTSRDGLYQTRGFLGEYDISVSFDGYTVFEPASLTADGDTVVIKIPTTQTGLQQSENSPLEYGLLQNYPNPFNASTIVEFTPVQSGDMELVVFDTRGARIFSKKMNVHFGQRYRQELSFANLPSGSYFYALVFEDGTQSNKKMLLLK